MLTAFQIDSTPVGGFQPPWPPSVTTSVPGFRWTKAPQMVVWCPPVKVAWIEGFMGKKEKKKKTKTSLEYYAFKQFKQQKTMKDPMLAFSWASKSFGGKGDSSLCFTSNLQDIKQWSMFMSSPIGLLKHENFAMFGHAKGGLGTKCVRWLSMRCRQRTWSGTGTEIQKWTKKDQNRSMWIHHSFTSLPYTITCIICMNLYVLIVLIVFVLRVQVEYLRSRVLR